MTLINIRNLGVTLGTTLFSGLNLAVGTGDRIGLVAANGRGKSTLLRCMAGTGEANEGEILRSRGLTVGHMEQHVPRGLMDKSFHAAVFEALFRRPEAQRTLAGRCRIAFARSARDVAAEAAEASERRLAAACHARPRARDGGGLVVAGRADQPP